MSGYQIADEPAPGPLARFAVDPLFPFLSIMLGGLWPAFPWFAFNAVAVGSPTRRRELVLLLQGLVLLCLLALLLIYLVDEEVLAGVAIRYALLSLPVVKLAVLYAVYILQARTVEIYRYYGGVLQNGFIVIVALVFLQPNRLLSDMPLLLQLVFG